MLVAHKRSTQIMYAYTNRWLSWERRIISFESAQTTLYKYLQYIGSAEELYNCYKIRETAGELF